MVFYSKQTVRRIRCFIEKKDFEEKISFRTENSLRPNQKKIVHFKIKFGRKFADNLKLSS